MSDGAVSAADCAGFLEETIEVGPFPSRFTSSQPGTVGKNAHVCAAAVPSTCGNQTASLFLASASPGDLSFSPVLPYMSSSVVFLSQNRPILRLLVSSFHHVGILVRLCPRSVGSAASLTDSMAPLLLWAAG